MGYGNVAPAPVISAACAEALIVSAVMSDSSFFIVPLYIEPLPGQINLNF